jgi:glycosyltransferase involved in cell wall biosynthesis
MRWVSNTYTKRVVEQYGFLLPKDFDPIIYTLLHPDLIVAGIDDEQKAKEHYILYGRKENRAYKKIVPSFSETVSSHELVPEIWNNGKNLLYFSPMAPDYDTSSGGNRLLEILKILKIDLQYNVWFLCNGSSKKKYLDALDAIKIPYFLPDIDKQIYLDTYLKKAKKSNIVFDNVIFSWYDIANQYLDIVKKYYPNIKIIIDTVDVHWIREQRGKDSGHLNIRQSILDVRKKIEKQVYLSANVIFAVTEKDKEYIQDEIGYNHNIKILSNIHHKHTCKLGNNIVFIGNYAHGPNLDGAIRSIEIFKSFQLTNIYNNLKIKPKLLLIGPNLDKTIQDNISSDPSIEYLGCIEKISDVYKKTSILIAPLNWGAGIKGKICDAGMSGIPIITSSIGNEGINFIHKNHAIIAESNFEFIDGLQY